MTRSRGRPSKYEPRFCDELLAFMAEGFSLTAFAGEIGVARSTINEWMGEHPEFSEAVRIGQAKRTGKLERTLLEGESGPKVTAHIFALKNADPDGWKDKVETAHSGLLTLRRAEELTEDELVAIATGSGAGAS